VTSTVTGKPEAPTRPGTRSPGSPGHALGVAALDEALERRCPPGLDAGRRRQPDSEPRVRVPGRLQPARPGRIRSPRRPFTNALPCAGGGRPPFAALFCMRTRALLFCDPLDQWACSPSSAPVLIENPQNPCSHAQRPVGADSVPAPEPRPGVKAKEGRPVVGPRLQKQQGRSAVAMAIGARVARPSRGFPGHCTPSEQAERTGWRITHARRGLSHAERTCRVVARPADRPSEQPGVLPGRRADRPVRRR
jgi:hypothetical protein